MKWTDDEEVLLAFERLMVDSEINMNRFMKALSPYFDDSPNSILIRLLGFSIHYYNEAIRDELDTHEAYNHMIQRMAQNPLAQALFQNVGMGMMNKGAGV